MVDSTSSSDAPAPPDAALESAAPQVIVSRTFSRWDFLVGGFFFAFLLVVSWFLFAPPKSVILFNDVSRSESLILEEGAIIIAYDQPLATYEPTASGVVNRGYLANVYEGLVRFDRDFKIEPALALSWGMINDDTWEFKLRPDVFFHDDSSFGSEDVLVSIQRARAHPDSEVQNLVASIDYVIAIDDLTVQFKTTYPDPTLQNKLTMLWMIPEELSESVPTPVGTGAYSFVRQVGDDEWQFERFESYWGPLPSYPNLILRSVPDKFERYEDFVAGEIDVLAQVPPVFVDSLLQMEYPVASLPTLEVNFLLFGWEDENSPFRHRELREAIAHAFDPEDLIDFTSGFGNPSNQFVSRGVLGYNPKMEGFSYDPEYAQEKVDSLGADFTVRFDYPEGLNDFATYVQDQLAQIGVTVELNPLPLEEYEAFIQSGESEFFFYGWRSEMGDAGDFFTNVIHSPTSDQRYGVMNKDRYEDTGVDQLIEEMDQNVLESNRADQLQDLMEFVVVEEIIGVPLFETNSLVAIQKGLDWNPRLDNLILAIDFH